MRIIIAHRTAAMPGPQYCARCLARSVARAGDPPSASHQGRERVVKLPAGPQPRCSADGLGDLRHRRGFWLHRGRARSGRLVPVRNDRSPAPVARRGMAESRQMPRRVQRASPATRSNSSVALKRDASGSADGTDALACSLTVPTDATAPGAACASAATGSMPPDTGDARTGNKNRTSKGAARYPLALGPGNWRI